ncbi:uncharacterized protein LOC125501947 [Athalia rosae]|uniref:uncharacterized protein LOC125501947 n=1 Tax=Athalia rosae TaxID=37344 RepID=UPI0020337096|nr:uncharacterized protein LOC125501947 [Athalia rosae]
MILSRWNSKIWYDPFTLLRFMNWWTGMGAYRPSDKRDFWYSCSWISTAFINLLQWLIIFNGNRIILDYINEQFEDSPSLPFLVKVLLLIMFSNSLIALIFPVLMWLERKRIMECYNQIPILDVKFRAIFGTKNQHGKQCIYLLCNILAISIIAIISIGSENHAAMLERLNILEKTCVIVVLHRPILIMLLVDLNFCIFVGYLEKKFRDMNEGLLQMAKPKSTNGFPGNVLPPFFRSVQKSRVGREMENDGPELSTNDYSYLLHEIRKAHLELTKMSRKINDAFGVQNLISLSVSFGVITGMFYAFYIFSRLFSASSWSDYASVFKSTPTFGIFSYLYTILKINFACGAAVKESLRTGQIICEIMETTKLEEEIEEFSIQMIHNPVQFDACGFFDLDYSFIQGVIGSITTYMVILIQMNPAPEFESRSSENLANVTKA